MSSFVVIAPDVVVAASQDLTRIGSAVRSAGAAAATSTTTVVAAAGDEVSVVIASLFGTFGRQYQLLSAQTRHGTSSSYRP